VYRVLQDANPGVPLRDVEQLFQEEFGMSPSDLFTKFEVRGPRTHVTRLHLATSICQKS
jgi:hypothetical protein